MAKTFKHIPSLHHLFDSAPVEALQALVLAVDDGRYASPFSAVAWPADLADVQAAAVCRQQLLDVAAASPSEAVLPLERHAERLLKLATGIGVGALADMASHWAAEGRPAAFDAQRDDYGRAIWTYVHAPRRFQVAENIYYAEHYRQMPRLYEAFRANEPLTEDFCWTGAGKQVLEAAIRHRLGLTEACQIDHIVTSKTGADGGKVEAHLLVIRHAGPLASVAQMKDGQKDALYYRPAVEATLLYAAGEQSIEVFAATAALRRQLAAVFAETQLGCDLSRRKLLVNCYNFARFAQRFALELPVVAGFDVEAAAVVEAEVKTPDLQRRLRLQVPIGDDFDRAVQELFGTDSVFRKFGAMTRVVIAVRYRIAGDPQVRHLKLLMGAPNRCNLHSHPDRAERELGFTLLAHWGILEAARELAPQEEHTLLPALLELHDHDGDTVGGSWLQGRALDRKRLVEGGFLRPRGSRIEEDATDEAVVPDWHGTGLASGAIQPVVEEFFEIQRDWLEEWLTKALQAEMQHGAAPHPSPYLQCLGYLDIDGQPVPVYLGRRLSQPRIINACDRLLRSPEVGEGVVLAPAAGGPEFLGMSMVMPIQGLVKEDAATPRLDVDRLRFEFRRRRALMRGAEQVELVRDGSQTATLRIPGKVPLQVVGDIRVRIFQRLVDAYRAGNPAVTTKELVDGTSLQSPSQAFPKDAGVIGVYLGPPPGRSRGAWQLLV